MRTAFIDLLVAYRNVIRQKQRSAFGLFIISFGIVALLLGGGFVEWILWAAREGAIRSGLGHVQVVRPGFFDSGLADPLKFLLPERNDDRAWIERMGHVHIVLPNLSFSGLISAGDTTLSFLGEGVDPELESSYSPISIIAEGTDLSAEDAQGIIMGRGLAANLGIRAGEKVVLLANTAAGGINGVEATVRGLFSTASKAYDDSAVRVPLSLAHRLLKAQGVHRWIIVLDETKLTEGHLRNLRARFPDRGYEFVPWTELADFYIKTEALLARQMGVVRLIIAVIIVLSISNTLSMSVLERTGEIGTTMALGATRRQILRRFVGEGLTLGIAGGAIGLATGVVLAALISVVGIPMPPPPGMATGYVAKILVTPALISHSVLLALGTALAASIYPAWKASRLVIVDALRQNR